MAIECMLTTTDNPYDPFDEFTLWNLFDLEKGYNTCSHLARLLQNLPEDLTDSEREVEEEKAMDIIMKHDFMHIYEKKYKETTNS